MDVRNGKTILWVPREAFASVERFWKPEFTWIPLPVDRSLPPDRIAFIQTNGPVSPLPPLPRPPKTPLSPLAPRLPQTPLPLLTPLATARRTPRHPAGLPPLETGALRVEPSDYFGGSPELETAITAGLSPNDSDGSNTPSTATEPASPSTPEDVVSPALHAPKIRRHSGRQSRGDEAGVNGALPELIPEPEQAAQSSKARQPPHYASDPWKMYDAGDDKWKMVDHRNEYGPAHSGVKQASWKRRSGKRDVKMNDHWQTFKRDEAHWTGSKKGFSVRLDMNLEMEVEIKGFVNGDITLSAEALFVSCSVVTLIRMM